MPALPDPDEFTAPFWDALRNGRLTVPECGECNHRFFVPEAVCPLCGATGWSWAASPGIGRVYSLSVVYQAVDPDVATPFALAAVDLDDGWTILTHIVGSDPEAVVIGDHVKLAPVQASATITLPTFEVIKP